MENKKANRNTKLIILAIVLALVVLFLCIGGSTFARYISSKNVPANQATVAKWGYVVNADADNLFGKNYSDTAIVADDATDAARLDVKASGSVVAPGTKGSMTFGVTGSAEVLAKLELAFNVKSEVALKKGETVVHSPVKWTLKQGTTEVLKNKTLAEIKTEIDKIGNVIEAGTTVSDKSYTLSWEWALGADDEATATTNRYDTLLGYAAKGAGEYGDVKVEVGSDNVITVTDKAPETAVTYTAVTKIEFDFSIKVVQLANSERPSTGA